VCVCVRKKKKKIKIQILLKEKPSGRGRNRYKPVSAVGLESQSWSNHRRDHSSRVFNPSPYYIFKIKVLPASYIPASEQPTTTVCVRVCVLTLCDSCCCCFEQGRFSYCFIIGYRLATSESTYFSSKFSRPNFWVEIIKTGRFDLHTAASLWRR
jgi:hypothetical protein